MENGKAWVRQWIAVGCMVGILVFSSFALFEAINLDVFWRVFATLNGYVGWFFISREREKNIKSK